MNTEFLQRVGGITSTNGAEIAALDPASRRLFVVAGSLIEVQGLSSTGAVTAVGTLPTGFATTADVRVLPNSVAVSNGIVAVAYGIQDVATNAQRPGRVSFHNAATGAFINSVLVGALPDMLTFTADGTKVLVANEGEPNSYGQVNSFDPEGSVSIINIAGGAAAATVQTADFTSFNSRKAELQAAGVRIFGPGATVAQDLEPEYIAIAPDGLTARVVLQENNAIAVLNIATATITDIFPLGLKNYNLPGNAIDASDRDSATGTGRINIQNYPAFGLYQPDAIASYAIGGQTYYVTANEGDARDYPGFNEESRVAPATYVLDPVLFPNAATLKQNANLGRLTVTTATGDTDGDGDFDRIVSFGGRSFSIWDATGRQVYDSGDQFEQITATKVPDIFNSDGTTATFDTRSDNKGPEPEGVAIGVINNRTYAFIGLERTGDVIVYDVTTPAQPQFVYYINTPEDLAVEGLTFVAAADSPTGKPLLITAAEVSRTVSVYEVNAPVVPPTRNDFNGDGKSDILWRSDIGGVAVWQMNGATVTSTSLTSTPNLDNSWKTAGTGDFNGDSKSDILWRNDSGAVAVWTMNGSTVTASNLTSTLSLDNSWKTAGTGDFNGDGKSDILWRNDSGAVAVWTMNGASVVSSSLTSTPTLAASWKAAGTGDFNGDGKTDILWRNDDGSVALWQMNGANVVSSSLTSTPALANSWKAAGTGDFNGDGKSDILWRNDDGSVALWQMNGSTVTSSSLTSTPSLDSTWKIAGTGDFNGDSKSDILWRKDSGATDIWTMNGSSVVSSTLTSTQPLASTAWQVAAPIL